MRSLWLITALACSLGFGAAVWAQKESRFDYIMSVIA
jgi:hypothetical protein